MFHLTGFEHILSLFGEYAVICILITFTLTMLIIPYPNTCIKNYTTLNCLNFVKIFLTLGIVLHHIFNYLEIWNKADFCVEFFFVISGFLLFYTYNSSKTIKNFVISKFFRFIPYIFFANLLSLFGKENIDWTRFSSSIFLFSTTPIYPYHAYYMPTWYLVVLFWVSFFYFIIMRLTQSKALFWIACTTILSLLALRYQYSPIENYNVLMPWLNNGIIRGFAYMGIGYCLATIYLRYRSFFTWNNQFSGFLAICLLIYIPLTLFKQSFAVYWGVDILCFVTLCILLLCSKGYLYCFIEKKLWQQLAEFTLPIYMTHDIIVPVIIYGSDILVAFSLPIKVLILLIVSVLSGIFTYYMFYVAQLCHRKIFKQKRPSS